MYVRKEGSGLEESEGEELTLLEEWVMIVGKGVGRGMVASW